MYGNVENAQGSNLNRCIWLSVEHLQRHVTEHVSLDKMRFESFDGWTKAG